MTLVRSNTIDRESDHASTECRNGNYESWAPCLDLLDHDTTTGVP